MIFVGVLVGFITVLCIGNYFRAKRAQERQKQRRLAKQSALQQKQGYGVNHRIQAMQGQTHGQPHPPLSPGSSAYTPQEVDINGAGYEPPFPISA